jgi:hypothetical protein
MIDGKRKDPKDIKPYQSMAQVELAVEMDFSIATLIRRPRLIACEPCIPRLACTLGFERRHGALFPEHKPDAWEHEKYLVQTFFREHQFGSMIGCGL